MSVPSHLKVAFTFVSMPVGGAEDFAATVAPRLPKPWQPVFVCLRELGPVAVELRAAGHNVQLVRAAPGKRWNPAGILRLARFFRHERVQIVYSQTYNAHTYAIPAARLAGAPSVIHQQKTFQPLRPHRMLMMRWLTRLATRTLALSEQTRADLVRAFRLDDQRTAVVPNVINLEEFQPAPHRAALRARLGLPPETFLIGAAASLNAVKNHPATLRMAAAARDSGARFRLILLGEGKDRPALESLRTQLHLDNVAEMPGNKRPLGPWLQSLDLLVHPSLWEGQPLALLQALACDVPVIASRIEGNVAVLRDSHPGLFNTEDEATYLRMVERAIRDSQFRCELLEHQRQTLTHLPTADAVAADLARLFSAIAGP